MIIAISADFQDLSHDDRWQVELKFFPSGLPNFAHAVSTVWVEHYNMTSAYKTVLYTLEFFVNIIIIVGRK